MNNILSYRQLIEGNKGYAEITFAEILKKAGGWSAIKDKFPLNTSTADDVIDYLHDLHAEIESEYFDKGYSEVGILDGDDIEQPVYDHGYSD